MPMPRNTAGHSQRRTAGKSSQLSPKAAKSMADLARAAAPNCEHGVMAFVFRDLSVLPPARVFIEKRALNGRTIADRSIPSLTTLTSLYGGAAAHELAMARIFDADGKGSASGDERHRFESVGLAREINIFSMEGMHIPLSHATRGGCVTVAQSLSKKPQDSAREVLIRLDEQAKKEGSIIFLFLTCPDGRPESWLMDCCGEVFVVDAYEPEPDASLGFSISAMKLGMSHSLGVGKVACDVTIEGNTIRHRWGTFVAATLEERAMLYLYQEGLSLRDISEIFGVDDHVKVWRKLKDIAARVTVQPPEDWREKYFDCLGLDPGEDDASDEESIDDDASSEDDLGEWDDDPAPNPPVKRVRRLAP